MKIKIISKVDTAIKNRENYYNVYITSKGLSWFSQIKIDNVYPKNSINICTKI